MLWLCQGMGCGAAEPVATQGAATQRDIATQPANVLIYIVDTLRADALGAYGAAIETPNSDALAREGTLFRNSFASSSWTRSSVASILTGRTPLAHGARTRHSSLAPEIESLAEILSREGYATGFISANPNIATAYGFDRGLDAMIELWGPRAANGILARSDEATEHALVWLDSLVSRDTPDAQRPPFLLIVQTVDPHAPYVPPQAFDRYMPDYVGKVSGKLKDLRRDDLSLADKLRARALYDAEISANDHALGALLDALRVRALIKNTLVILTADHGEEFWEYQPTRRGHGNELTDAQIRVPLIVSFPGSARVPRGARPLRPVTGTDILPTVLDLLGLVAPDGLDGRSLFASEPSDATPRPLYASVELDGRRLHAIVEYPWKLVWDSKRNESRFYNLEPGGPGASPVDSLTVHPSDEIRARLRAHLETRLANANLDPRTGKPAPAGGDTADLEAPLRALGYIE